MRSGCSLVYAKYLFCSLLTVYPPSNGRTLASMFLTRLVGWRHIVPRTLTSSSTWLTFSGDVPSLCDLFLAPCLLSLCQWGLTFLPAQLRPILAVLHVGTLFWRSITISSPSGPFLCSSSWWSIQHGKLLPAFLVSRLDSNSRCLTAQWMSLVQNDRHNPQEKCLMC